jgi:hypothetical protein
MDIQQECCYIIDKELVTLRCKNVLTKLFYLEGYSVQ